MVAIADELYRSALKRNARRGQYFLEIVRDERLDDVSQRRHVLAGTHGRFGVVELHASRKATLGEKAELGDDELVELTGWLAGVG